MEMIGQMKVFIVGFAGFVTLPAAIFYVIARFVREKEESEMIQRVAFIINLLATVCITEDTMAIQPFVEFNAIIWGLMVVVDLLFWKKTPKKKSDDDKKGEEA